MKVEEPKMKWGGPWTERKLEAFEKYVRAYLKIMNKKNWKTIYFDGFAGSGDRRKTPDEELQWLDILPEEEMVYRGSAERVLKIDKGLKFDYYYFVDKDESALNELKDRLESLPEVESKKLEFRAGDCNEEIKRLGKALKGSNKYAALVLLDPFGMQINWDSIAELQSTRSDLWILVPTGVIVNRLLDRKRELKNIKKLVSFFGISPDDIKNHFYKKEHVPTLFGEEEKVSKISEPIRRIAELYIARLKEIFKHVTSRPLILKNSKNVPIFHFVFASNNQTALKIASQIIGKT